MAFLLALLVGIAVIAGLMIYWAVMITLFYLGIIFAVWYIALTVYFENQSAWGVVSLIIAALITLAMLGVFSKKDSTK